MTAWRPFCSRQTCQNQSSINQLERDVHVVNVGWVDARLTKAWELKRWLGHASQQVVNRQEGDISEKIGGEGGPNKWTRKQNVCRSTPPPTPQGASKAHESNPPALFIYRQKALRREERAHTRAWNRALACYQLLDPGSATKSKQKSPDIGVDHYACLLTNEFRIIAFDVRRTHSKFNGRKP